jgi:hypothetical protein
METIQYEYSYICERSTHSGSDVAPRIVAAIRSDTPLLPVHLCSIKLHPDLYARYEQQPIVLRLCIHSTISISVALTLDVLSGHAQRSPTGNPLCPDE